MSDHPISKLCLELSKLCEKNADLERRLAVAVEALTKISEDKIRIEYRHRDDAVYEPSDMANIAKTALSRLAPPPAEREERK